VTVCIYIHDRPGDPATADRLMPYFVPDGEPTPDNPDGLIVGGWSPVCPVDAETWYDDSDVPASLIAANPPRSMEGTAS
jgi:hypothetical protein